MLNQILKFKTALMVSLCLSLFCPGVFAQGHQEGNHGSDNRSTVNRDHGSQFRGNGHGNRHYYHNGNWNRNGWYGWGINVPVFSDGVLVSTLPPDSTTVLVSGNTYYYGNNTYFRPVLSGGFVVVSQP